MFSFDGQRIASVSGNPDTVRVWDVVFGSLLQTFVIGGIKSIQSVALSPDGQNIVFGYRNGMIAIRGITFGSLLKTFEGHCCITSVVFSPNGQKLASASLSTFEKGDGAIYVWDVASGSRLQMAEGDFTSVIFSPDGHKLASRSTNGAIHIWDAQSRSLLQMLQGHKCSITWITFLSNGQDLASGADEHTVRVWNMKSGLLSQSSEGYGHGTYVAISPDGQKLASRRDDHTVGIWNLAFGSSAQTLKGHHACVKLMMFSPGGQKLASVSGRDHDRICIWDVATGSLLQTFEGHTESATSITFSPDGEKLAYISKDISGGRVLLLWDAAVGLRELEHIHHIVTPITFSPDGEKLAYISNDISGGRVLQLWNAVLGLRKLERYRYGLITSVKFSPDGQKLALLSLHSIKCVWDAVFGLPLQTVADDYNWVQSSAISTVNQPEVLSITGRWVTMNEKKILWLPPARQASEFVIYGTKIAIGSTTGVVTILDLDLNQMDPYFTSPSVP